MRQTASVAPLRVASSPAMALVSPHAPSLWLGSKSTILRSVLWWLVVFLELSNAVLLALLATSYFTHARRGSLLWVVKVYFLFSDAYHFLERFSIAIASGYAVLSVAFLYRAALVVGSSIRHRTLRFSLLETPKTRSSSLSPSSSSPRHSRPRSLRVRWTRRISQALYQLRTSIGVHGAYFEARLLLDEIVELVCQTLAAHASSQSISNVPLNQVYGVVIVVNSLSTTVFQRVFPAPTHLTTQRVARLLTDLVLDFVWGTLLPIWMYEPILRTYNKQKNHGDSIDSTENSAREVERVLVLSWWSFVLSIVPFCNSLLNLVEVRALLSEQDDEQGGGAQSSTAVIAPVAFSSTLRPKSMQSLMVKQGTASSGLAQSQPTSQSVVQPQGIRYWFTVSCMIHGLHLLIAVMGVGIFATSLLASDLFGLQPHQVAYGCVHRVHPWFATKEACIGRAIDCQALGTSGSSDEIEAALRVFDAHSLADLFISNCVALNLSTPWLQHFPRLQTLEISNSTIVSWHKDVSALSYDKFQELRTVKLQNVSLATSPHSIALFTTPLSRSAEWVYITETDMSEALVVPNLVGDHWQHLIYLDCASCQLPVFPTRVVQSMERLIMLSLIDNDIASVPADWPSPSRPQVMVWFDGNPRLAELPDALWQQTASSLQSVYVQRTSLAHVPVWLPQATESNPVLQVYAHDSPLCRRVTSATSSSSGDDKETALTLPSFVSCDFQEL